MKHLILFLFVSTLSWGQNATRQFVSVEKSNNGYKVVVSDGVYYFSAYSGKMVETTFIPNGQKHPVNSHAVVASVETDVLQLTQSIGVVRLTTSAGLKVNIQQKPFQISYWHHDKPVISENWGYEKAEDSEKIHFNLTTDELLYGAGARALGMNRRGYRLQLYNRAHYGYEEHSELMNYTMPMVVSNKCYAIHFDNAQIGYLDLDSKKNNVLTYETIGGRKTYQVIVGDDWKDLLSEYTNLTGHQPMPPRWVFGNFASRFGYHSEAEARNVVNQFRKDSIPLDAIIFDLYWFGKEIQGTLGNLSFYTDSFPHPKEMISDFKNQGVKTVLITEPFILTTSKKWQEASDKKILGTNELGAPFTYDFYFGNTGLLDLFKPEARTWFWDIYKDLHNYGARGFWGDLGEPEVHPAKLKHAVGYADEVHNIYGHEWAKLIYEGYQKDYPNERPFILMRSGSTGTQRFGIIPWSGDVNRTWGGLRPQMEITLQMGLQGIAYMHSDLGGFGGANDDPELYVRWLQYGVFQPVFRPHGQEEVASEAIFKDEKTKQLAKEAIELRYQMLPYNYSLAFENHVNGTPLMRPVFMEDLNAKWSESIADEYMWGSCFLVKPITKKIEANSVPIQMVHAPGGTWYDLKSGLVLKSLKSTELTYVPDSKLKDYEKAHSSTMKKEQTFLMGGDLSSIPVLVKGGSFVPMSPIIQSTESYSDTMVTIHYYDAPELTVSQGIWYEDDGLTNEAYEKGAYKLLQMSMFQKAKKTKLSFDPNYGTKMLKHDFVFGMEIHSARIPKSISVNGKKMKFEVIDQKIKLRMTLTEEVQNIQLNW
jgi:alpha-glucosidase (family GH31 glycosyl hydrolase)